MTRRLLFIATLLLAGCGVRAPLEPEPGQSLPVAPETAAGQPTSEELLEPPPIARPARVDELLTRSEEREEDRFDLPPQ
ncbi:MAG TPA: lipoprotein [Allosphingosinicella sp.]|nr:lipoprotein [Allosphingosinicella sp.]